MSMGIVEAAVLAERERIIKMLTDEVPFPCGDRDPFEEHYDDTCNCRIIALIKGENK